MTTGKFQYIQTCSVMHFMWRQAEEDYVEEEICLLRS